MQNENNELITRIMKTTILFTNLMVATLMFTACSKEDNSGDNWDGRLHLSSGVATLTRSTHNLDVDIIVYYYKTIY